MVIFNNLNFEVIKMTLFYCISFIVAVKATNDEELFQGVRKRPYEEQVSLDSLIPQALISQNTDLSNVKQKECDNSITNCIKCIDNFTDEIFRQVANDVYTEFSSTMQEYTQLAYLVIISSIRDNKYVEIVSWVNLLSLSSHKGHCLLEFIYRANIKYGKTLFKNYLFFSDLENIFITSVDKPYTSEKLLQLIEDKTKIPRPSDKNGVYKELLNDIHQMRTKINQQSERFCSITGSWFHPNNLKFKKVIYNAKKSLIELIDSNYTLLENKQVFSKCNKSKWYDCIRSENDMEVLFQFSNLVITSMIQKVAHNAVGVLCIISLCLMDFDKEISKSNFINNYKIHQYNSSKLRIMINEYLNDLQKIKKMIFEKHGIKVELNNDLFENIKYIFNVIYIKLENILNPNNTFNIICELVDEITKYKKIISENINYRDHTRSLSNKISWNNCLVFLDGNINFVSQTILELLE
ncbi:uncharacterized protein LOC126901807 [Daktulosphaira vitifoliae]|uniref:uncharacterized protein LOC126901807 n=1 Tax=Daktulosphaira vitifoliae TaxID=58002 RepID=UPI0021AAEFF8|nr:uncharacterized protein LOC126901807 [Daktulosphaira vitifoliae]